MKMDSNVEKMHLQSLEEYVWDEEKIVTYRWLSKVLNIHVNLSKELLHKFSSDPSHENKFYLTYLISGKVKDGSYRVLVVGQDIFEEAKSDFDVITSHHVYSVQKKKETPSANLLYMVNSEKVENEVDVNKQIGVIKCAHSIQRVEDEMLNLRQMSLLKNAPSGTPIPVKKTTTNSVKQEVGKKDEKETQDKTPENKPKAATGGIAAMFAAQTSKPSSTTASSSKSNAKPAAKKGGGINSFFSKVPKTESPPKVEAQEKVNGKLHTDEPMDVDDSSEKSDKDESDFKTAKPEKNSEASVPKSDTGKVPPSKTVHPKDEENSTSKTNGKTPKNKSKKKSKPKSSAKQEKTRKRIKIIDSESSDDMFGSESENEDPPIVRNSPSPPPSRKIVDSDDEVIPATPQPQNDTKNHRKRKVVKDKSYMDEDGFIVTEKVTVYESCSDSESEKKDNLKKQKEEESTSKTSIANEPASKAIKQEKPSSSNKETKKPAKKTVSPMKNKQSSLMSFFKKA